MTKIVEINREVRRLAEPQQQLVLDFARSLGEPRAKTEGVKISDLTHLIGLFSHEDLAEMKAAIEEGCENIDAEGW